jgi:hypothetical protein
VTGSPVPGRLGSVRARWSQLRTPEPADLIGTHEAVFTGPRLLRELAPLALAPVGLPRWFGKQFTQSARDPEQLEGINLLRAGGGFRPVLPMKAALGPSFADGLTAIVVSYPPDSPLPWRHVRDEFRPWDDTTLAGLSWLDLPGARHFGLPFFLVPGVALPARSA